MKKYRGIIFVLVAGTAFLLLLKYFGNNSDGIQRGPMGQSTMEDSLRFSINAFEKDAWNELEYNAIIGKIGAAEMAGEIKIEQLNNLKSELEAAKMVTLVKSFDEVNSTSCSSPTAFNQVVKLIQRQLSIVSNDEAQKRLDQHKALSYFISLELKKNRVLSVRYNSTKVNGLIQEINAAYYKGKVSNCYDCTVKKNAWISSLNKFEDIESGFNAIKDRSYLQESMCVKFKDYKFYKDTLSKLGLCPE